MDVRAPWQNGRTERHGDLLDALPERPGSASTLVDGMQCRQESAVQSFRLLPLQRIFGIGHRLPADLTSDDVAPDPICDLAATDASFEESRQIREVANEG